MRQERRRHGARTVRHRRDDAFVQLWRSGPQSPRHAVAPRRGLNLDLAHRGDRLRQGRSAGVIVAGAWFHHYRRPADRAREIQLGGLDVRAANGGACRR